MKKSTKGFHFCSNACRNEVQRIGGPKEFLPSHYGTGTGVRDYRERAFAAYDPECADCGWNLIDDVLEVHHKDRDRTNNDVANLIILCPTCHDLTHWVTRSGKWGQGAKKLLAE